MAFIPTPGTVRVDIQYVQQGQQVHNIVWCEREASWTQAEREALAAAIHTWWNTAAKTNFSTDIALSQITVVNQESQEAPSSTLVISPVEPGTGSGSALSTNAAACATLRTAYRGRNYRGRMYLGGTFFTALQNSISWTTTQVGYWVTMLNALNTAITALGAVWVVVSKWLNKIPRASGLTTPISAISMDTYVDSQRRRLGLRGV